MLQLVGLVIVLAVVYAVKVAVVMRSHEELAQKSASFSWMSAKPEDLAAAESWAAEEEAAQAGAGIVMGGLHTATGARA